MKIYDILAFKSRGVSSLFIAALNKFDSRVKAKMGEADMMKETVREISLKDLSRKLEEFAQARDWEKYHSPRNLLLAMVNFPTCLVALVPVIA